MTTTVKKMLLWTLFNFIIILFTVRANELDCEKLNQTLLIAYDKEQSEWKLMSKNRLHFQLVSHHFLDPKRKFLNGHDDDGDKYMVRVSIKFWTVIDINLNSIHSLRKRSETNVECINNAVGQLNVYYRYFEHRNAGTLKYKLNFRVDNSTRTLGYLRYNHSCVHRATIISLRPNLTLNSYFNMSECVHSVRAIRFAADYLEDVQPMNYTGDLIYEEDEEDYIATYLVNFARYYSERYLLPLNSTADSFSLQNKTISWPILPLQLLAKMRLKTLDLSNSYIASIPRENFPYFPSLTALNLNNCGLKLTTLENVTCRNISNLSRLSLAANKLTSLPSDFKYLTKLEFLNLSSNSFENTFEFSSHLFQFLANLKCLDISRMVVAMRVANRGEAALFTLLNYMPRLETLRMSDVVIEYNYLAGSGSLYTEWNYNSSFSSDIKALYLRNNSEAADYAHSLICLGSQFFPRLSVLDLSNNNIQDFLPHPNELSAFYPHFPPELSELNLSGNQLNHFFYVNLSFNHPFNVDRSFFILNLSHNRILDWNESKVLRYYVDEINNNFTLDLSHNKMSLVNPLMISDLSGWNKVYLHDNEFDCSQCAVDPFYDYLIRNQIDNPKCSFPMTKRGLFITDLIIIPDECGRLPIIKEFDYLMVVVLPLGIVLTITIVIVALLVKYKWYAQFFCYLIRNQIFVRLGGERAATNEDERWTFDAFVCYSSADSGWLVNQLIPHLEREEPQLHLCIHDRDFLAGGAIISNIIECIDISRKTLCLVSKKFTQSQWCQWELHMAHHKLFEDGNDVLILILLEDLEGEQVPRTLQRLMRTRTYLVWPVDPNNEPACKLFWARLRRAIQPCNCLQLQLDSSL